MVDRLIVVCVLVVVLYTWYYYWVAGSGELDAREVNTVGTGTLHYFVDLFHKT